MEKQRLLQLFLAFRVELRKQLKNVPYDLEDTLFSIENYIVELPTKKPPITGGSLESNKE